MKKLILIMMLVVLLPGCSNDIEDSPPTCSENEVVENGVCVEKVEELVCVSPEVLLDNVCVELTPVITLDGDNVITLEAGERYVDPGYSAMYDDEEIRVTLTGVPDMTEVGTYTIYYNASYEDMNAEEQTRTVHVVDTTAPEISFNRFDDFTHELGVPYTHNGIDVKDNTNSYSELMLHATGNVDVNTLGSYEMSYYAVDTHGNTSETITKTVEVVMKEELSFIERYLKDNTALYSEYPMENNYTYDKIEWVHQGLVVENGEYKPILIFFLHNEIDGDHVLKKIDFVCPGDNLEYELDDETIDYAFQIPMECITRNSVGIVTYAHDEYRPGEYWNASMYVPFNEIDPEEILKKKLQKGNLL